MTQPSTTAAREESEQEQVHEYAEPRKAPPAAPALSAPEAPLASVAAPRAAGGGAAEGAAPTGDARVAGESSASSDTEDDDGAPPQDGARALEEELAAEASSRPRSLVESLGWDAADEAAAGELRDLGDLAQLVLEVADLARAPPTPDAARPAPTPAPAPPRAHGQAGGAADIAVDGAPAADEGGMGAKERLVAALRARLFDAQGEALLELGPIVPDRADECFSIVRALCDGELGCRTHLVLTREAGRGKQRRVRLDVLVRLPPSEQRHLNLRVAVIGNVDAGKSTLVGVLVGGTLDNGRGSARMRVLKHKHEAETGRTSSIAEDQHLGFDQVGNIVNAQHGQLVSAAAGADADNVGGGGGPSRAASCSWQEVVQRSSKVVSFIDLACVCCAAAPACSRAPPAAVLPRAS